ncbi:MAG: chloride channel protein [Clostridia bacterium]|nr:chloride channel protein [Clostridia bacterium]
MKWGLLGVLMGCIGGLLGAVFHHTIHFVTGLRQEQNWLIFLLPVGGLIIVGLYRLFRLQANRGTDDIIDSVLNGKQVSPLVAPAIFLAATITHLFGGSAGREGAALQMGGSFASLLNKLLRMKDEERTVLIMSGMSAVFAGLFGTPLTACLFTMEFESVGTIFSPALLPCFVSALVASKLSFALGVHAEVFVWNDAVALNFKNTWKFVVLAVLVSLLGIAMCYVFRKVEYLAHKWFRRPWLRIIIGAMVIVGLTLLVGDQRFSGAGMDMALQAIGGSADWYSFLLKMLFTSVTLAVGFKGGEIVPTFCIGATFGCLIGGLLGLDPGFAAALGLVGLFCAITNSPLASIVLSIEMFGGTNLHLFVLVCTIAFVMSGKSCLYSSQVIQYSKPFAAENKKHET